MQYIPIHLVPGCEPILIDTKEIEIINDMQTMLSESFIKNRVDTEPAYTYKAVVYGVFKQQPHQSVNATDLYNKKPLVLLQKNEIHQAQIIDIEVISSQVTYSSIYQKESLKTDDIGFAALIEIPTFVDIAKISSCYRIPAISLFEHDDKTPLIESICSRTGIYAIKAVIATNQEISVKNWRELIDIKQANIVFTKTI